MYIDVRILTVHFNNIKVSFEHTNKNTDIIINTRIGKFQRLRQQFS